MRRLLVMIVIMLFAGACGRAEGGGGSGSLRVATSFYPLAFVAEAVGGDGVEVINLTPPGTEPHDLELTPRQVGDVSDSDLLLYFGRGFQPAVEDAAGEARRAVDVLDELGIPDDDEFDPHVWLDPALTADIALAVADHLSDIDPDDSERYASNARALVSKLEDLDADWQRGLENCERSEIVVSHDAFGYLADKYGLEQISISGLDPEAEPSPARAAEVADLAAELGVTTIFFETLVSPDIAETIAREVGVRTEMLDPIESAPQDTDYIGAMRANLDALKEALGCE